MATTCTHLDQVAEVTPSSSGCEDCLLTGGRPIVLAVELGGIENFPGGPRHAGFEATTEIRRKDFGIDIAMPPGISAVALGDVVKVELDLQLLEPDS